MLVTLRNGTDGGPFIADDEWYGRVYEAVLTEGPRPTSSTLSSSVTAP